MTVILNLWSIPAQDQYSDSQQTVGFTSGQQEIYVFGPTFKAQGNELEAGWLQTVRGRKQFRCLLVVVVLQISVPFVVHELYPFSAATMFAYSLDQVAVYSVVAPDGERLSRRSFGLQINNPHDPPVMTLGRYGYGRMSPSTIQQRGSAAPYGNVASRQDVFRQVQSRLLTMPHLPYVRVTQSVLGPLDSQQVGVMRKQTWKVMNPKTIQP